MLTVTDNAKQMLTEMLEKADAPEGKAVRFVTEGQQVQLTLDDPQADDATFEHDGRTVLLISPEVKTVLDGQELDAVQTEQGQGLALKPQAE